MQVLHFVLQTFRSRSKCLRQDCIIPKCHIKLQFEVSEVCIQSNISMHLKNALVVRNRQKFSVPENFDLLRLLVPINLTTLLLHKIIFNNLLFAYIHGPWDPYCPILSFKGELVRLGSSYDDSEPFGSAIFEQIAYVFIDCLIAAVGKSQIKGSSIYGCLDNQGDPDQLSPIHIFTRVEYDDDENFFRSRSRRIQSPNFAFKWKS
ncbi:MAG: hypothetical protein EZS28_026988 [Streblomastix strix]|uniref:Uncharacterized protein n=1 Tax=Streblomastix strix TaxID=222440 RepID=A0A5J4V555_9EUKA|nr:MAG: hypothetical protein EZS28_026988 [Streblomastix strix]